MYGGGSGGTLRGVDDGDGDDGGGVEEPSLLEPCTTSEDSEDLLAGSRGEE